MNTIHRGTNVTVFLGEYAKARGFLTSETDDPRRSGTFERDTLDSYIRSIIFDTNRGVSSISQELGPRTLQNRVATRCSVTFLREIQTVGRSNRVFLSDVGLNDGEYTKQPRDTRQRW